MKSLRAGAVVATAALAYWACTGGSPAQPTTAAKPTAAASTGSARAANSAPILILKTKPVADQRTLPYPTIQGVVPLSVRFNLCPSDDVDQIFLPNGDQDPRGDSLNWQFNYGDYNSRQPAFTPSGAFNPDIDQTCRVDHVYDKAGSYVATLSVTDKHVDDQSRGVSALSRTTTRVTVNVFPVAPPSDGPSILSFTVSGACPHVLVWTTNNATSVTISGIGGTFPPNGSTTSFNNGFTLTATGPGGTASLTLGGPGNCDG